MNKLSLKSLAILGGVLLICGGLYSTREGWSPWGEGATGASVAADPNARSVGASAVPDLQAASSVRGTDTFVVRSHYELQGVMGGAGPDASGLALIAVDGAPARTVRVGEVVGDGLVLLGMSPRGALLGLPGGPPLLVLEVGVPSATQPAQLAGQSTPAGSTAGSVLPIGSASPMPALAYDASGAPLVGAVMTQALPLPAADRVTGNRNPPQAVPHPGRHQRLQSVKPAP
jgi:hypothetical protein